MQVTRVRFGSVLEWLVAAACIVAVLAGVALLLGEARTFKAVTPVIAGGAPVPRPPANLPPRAVSVPMLLIGGAEIHVGERSSEVVARLSGWQSGSSTIERSEFGERVTRFYSDGARKFLIVAEPSAAGQEARVAAIYVY